MESPLVKDDQEPGAGEIDLTSPRFMWGWRRFTANVVREALLSARFLAAFTLRNRVPGRPLKPRLEERIANACAAWLWVFGRGNSDFTFNECCEINGLESSLVLEGFVDILPTGEDIKRVDRWVDEHCRITGCLLPELLGPRS